MIIVYNVYFSMYVPFSYMKLYFNICTRSHVFNFDWRVIRTHRFIMCTTTTMIMMVMISDGNVNHFKHNSNGDGYGYGKNSGDNNDDEDHYE